MHIIVDSMGRQSMDNLFNYNIGYSLEYAIDIEYNIYNKIDYIEEYPYSGRYISKMPNKNYREVIYRKNRNSTYRIMYYISEKEEKIYVFYILNCRQDFQKILKINNYFKKYLDL